VAATSLLIGLFKSSFGLNFNFVQQNRDEFLTFLSIVFFHKVV